MAKKAELYAELKKLDKKTKLTEKNTIKELEAALEDVRRKLEGVSEENQETNQGHSGLDPESNISSVAKGDKKSIGSRDEHGKTADEAQYAKSGKRSKKYEEEVKAEKEKEKRKSTGDNTPQGDAESGAKTGPKPKSRPLIERRGKNYRKAAENIEKGKAYTLDEAIKLATETCPVKFDSTVEIHVRLGVDPKQSDQNIRGTVALPHGTGKTVRVAAFVPATDTEAVAKAGADIAGEETIIAALDKEEINFDTLIATPATMAKLSKYARILGPRGLMPNPKSGTVSTNPAQAVREAKAGKVEYRVDTQSNVHLGVGKVSFGTDKLMQNIDAFLTDLKNRKPSSLKSDYILSITIATTMGPGIRVSL